VARGGIIDEQALYEACKSKQVAAAAIDVFAKEPCEDSPLFTLDNVVVTPHLGASTEEAQVNVVIDVVEQIIEVLKGGTARSAVNIPSLKPEVLAKVKPFMAICEKLGKLASQLTVGAAKKIVIEYSGEVAEQEVAPLTIAVVKGFLDPIMGEKVNFVNAPYQAKDRGIEIVESKSQDTKDFASLISVRVTSDKGDQREVGGTIFGKIGDRLVSIDGFRIDAVPEGYLLILSNIDKPGMIGKVGSLLGKHSINIASMDVGRLKLNENAVMVLNVDSAVDEKVLKELTKIDGINGAKLVHI